MCASIWQASCLTKVEVYLVVKVVKWLAWKFMGFQANSGSKSVQSREISMYKIPFRGALSSWGRARGTLTKWCHCFKHIPEFAPKWHTDWSLVVSWSSHVPERSGRNPTLCNPVWDFFLLLNYSCSHRFLYKLLSFSTEPWRDKKTTQQGFRSLKHVHKKMFAGAFAVSFMENN